MTPARIDDITEFIQSLGGILTLAPSEGDGTPEIAWGDRFFYYAPTACCLRASRSPRS